MNVEEFFRWQRNMTLIQYDLAMHSLSDLPQHDLIPGRKETHSSIVIVSTHSDKQEWS